MVEIAAIMHHQPCHTLACTYKVITWCRYYIRYVRIATRKLVDLGGMLVISLVVDNAKLHKWEIVDNYLLTLLVAIEA